ncbi:MAG: phosphoribosylamine--glycine ligase [Dethiobacter sp.]|jgi:phosphoribosylamine--glycine ligase|nr:phosphoribosylamine--glycine ligase [Dethiobacter sp.]MBS3900303.1 phosphoribosylamine--glycine ligase [Dethiobacter sp.]MBS3982678.1 phosphoribosylamine--glycine ligase [Dethiobacter sp.]MCL4462565.1 phosphoribosylamine--glycine ligase [Bacillota bacterium]MCL5993417.1 phosphoribosylamine--glycine ligase [Bacillota bacterium]
MRVLVVGSGGREHVLVWKLLQSPQVKKVFCAPGNAGIAELAECVPIDIDQLEKLLEFARENKVDLTVVGPEAPLTAGLADLFLEAGLPVFGPNRAAAQLEGSKAFAKQIMEKYRIPTAESRIFTAADSALAYLKEKSAPIVVKADGLAAGKGVVVAATPEEAAVAVRRIMVAREFGEAGNRVLIEEFLEGEEVSVLAFSDGQTVIPMVSAQDHKAAYDGDTGPNTGGMGAYSPAPVLSRELLLEVEEKILRPTVAGLAAEGITFKGILYAGLMITKTGPKVLEYNVRFGDPECQTVLPRLKSDLPTIMLSVISGRLSRQQIEWRDNHTACVVMAAGGYPGHYEKGEIIAGLAHAAQLTDVYVFHAGTAQKDGKIVTAGGRVLGVTGWGSSLTEALQKAYGAVEKISFPGAHYRKDIGSKALSREQ